MKKNTKESQCNCPCHIKDFNIRHIMPCCNWTYEKFKDSQGNIIPEKIKELMLNNKSN